MRPRDGSRPPRRVPLVLAPWAVYVGVTVVAPAVHGAARDPAFAEHAIITLGVSGAVLLLWLAAGHGRLRRSAQALSENATRARRAGNARRAKNEEETSLVSAVDDE